MTAYFLIGNAEITPFYRLAAWTFNQTSPKALFITPGYYFFQDMICLAMGIVGGSIVILLSQRRERASLLFLVATVVVIAVLATLAIGFHWRTTS